MPEGKQQVSKKTTCFQSQNSKKFATKPVSQQCFRFQRIDKSSLNMEQLAKQSNATFFSAHLNQLSKVSSHQTKSLEVRMELERTVLQNTLVEFARMQDIRCAIEMFPDDE